MSAVIESNVEGEFRGWQGRTVVKLTNGQIWQQCEFHYYYCYAFRPHVLVYYEGGRTMMEVEGADKPVAVVRLK